MENKVEDGPVEILRREMGLENGFESDDVVYKRETIIINGLEVAVRRVFVLYGSYRVGWVHDADVQHCMVCQCDFGFFKRKHHCRACGSVVCSACSPYRTQVPSLGGDFPPVGLQEAGHGEGRGSASRVCSNCFGLKMTKVSQLSPKDVNGLIQNCIQKETSKRENAGLDLQKKSTTTEDAVQSRASRKKDKRAEMENVQFQLLEEPKYSKAYRIMRGMIPPFIATMNLKSLLDTGLPQAVAERIWSKRSLWLIIMHKQDIAKMHIADLRSKYTPIGLDLTERYAVWHNLPDWENEQPDEAIESGDNRSTSHENSNRAKIEWKVNFRVQMDEMARKHARNALADDLVRHSAYAGHEPIHLFSHRATIQKLYGNKNDSDVSSAASKSNLNPKHYRSTLSDMTASSTASSLSSASLSSCSSLHQPPLSPPSPASSVCSDTTSPVVTLFAHRQTTPSENNTGREDDPGTSLSISSHSGRQTYTRNPNGYNTSQPSSTASLSSLLPTVEEQRQKREERKQDRKRRASRGLQLQTQGPARQFSSSSVPSSVRGGGVGDSRTHARSSNSLDSVEVGIGNEQQRQRLSKVLSTPIELTPPPSVNGVDKLDSAISSSLSSTPGPQTLLLSPLSDGDTRKETESCVTPAASVCSTSEGLDDHIRAPYSHDSKLTEREEGEGEGKEGGGDGVQDNSAALAASLLSLDSSPPQSSSRRGSRRGSKHGAALLSSLIETELPLLTVTATPLRDLMADNTQSQRENVIEVMERLRSSDIQLTASEATELLKYAVVNLMDMRQFDDDDEGGALLNKEEDDAEYESAMLDIIDMLVVKYEADLDTLDRDGDNLLTFLQDSVTPDMHMSSRLVPSLVGHGISILVIQEQPQVQAGGKDVDVEGHSAAVLAIHPLFVSLSLEEKLALVTQFSSVSSVELSQSQKFTYFALLVVIGRSCLASLLVAGVRDVLTPQVASALLRICCFDSNTMEEPLETFELLDKHGATFDS